MPRLRHASSHVNDTEKITLDLGAKAIGAETCKLGANYHGTEVRVHFLKGYRRGRICENLSKKGQKAVHGDMPNTLLEDKIMHLN